MTTAAELLAHASDLSAVVAVLTATTRVVTPPASINRYGTADASVGLCQWIADQDDGSTLLFPDDAVYRLDVTAVQFAGRHGLRLLTDGATLRANGPILTELGSCIVVGHGYGGWWQGDDWDIEIAGFHLVGNSPTPGIFDGSREGTHGVMVAGGGRVAIHDLTVEGVGGDAVMADGPDGLTAERVHVVTCGRNGACVIQGQHIAYRHFRIDRAGYCVFDLEPYAAGQPAHDVAFTDSTAGTYGQDFAAVDGAHTGSAIDTVDISRNWCWGKDILTIIDNGGSTRLREITVRNNGGAVAAAGPRLRFAHVDGLHVSGNANPLTSGSLVSTTDCTGVGA